MATRIPSNVATGRRAPFPEGVFLGALKEVKDAWSDDQKNLALLLTFAEITAVEGPEVGARPKAQRITVIANEVALADIEEFTDDTPFQLTQAATLVTQLALAVGAAQSEEDGSVIFEMKEFLESLGAGAFNGSVVLFEVKHRTSKKDKSRVFDDISRFGVADTVEAPAVEAPAPTPSTAKSPVAKAAKPDIRLSGARTRT